MTDIDQIIATLKVKAPEIQVRQLDQPHAADDKGIWFFKIPGNSKEIQLESPTGNCPFTVEHDDMASSKEAKTADAPEIAVAYVLQYLTSEDWRKQPPGTTAELLSRYAQGERIFLNLGAEGDFSGDLQGADLRDALFSGYLTVGFSHAKLAGAVFVGNIKTCTFRNANCAGARFRAAIDGCDFTGANLDGADFEGSSFQGRIHKRGEKPMIFGGSEGSHL